MAFIISLQDRCRPRGTFGPGTFTVIVDNDGASGSVRPSVYVNVVVSDSLSVEGAKLLRDTLNTAIAVAEEFEFGSFPGG